MISRTDTEKEDGRVEMKFGEYSVKKERDKFFAVYDESCTPKKLLTHAPTWRKATKIATLLQEAHASGFQKARDLYDEEAWRV